MSKRNHVDRVPFELGCATRLTQGLCWFGDDSDIAIWNWWE